jgi:hypothetical protein
MSDAERHQRAILLYEQAMRAVTEENEGLAREAAILRCDKCPRPKHEYDLLLSLPNGIRLWVYCCRCDSPGSDCTAEVQSHLPSESPAVANRIVEWLAERPELHALGVTWFTCGENRHVLTYRTTAEGMVVAVAGAVPVDEFRTSRCT